MYIDKEELLEIIENKYGNLNDERGCSVYKDGEYVWLSIKDIVDLINKCSVFDED